MAKEKNKLKSKRDHQTIILRDGNGGGDGGGSGVLEVIFVILFFTFLILTALKDHAA
jgi:hypothetical protein